MYLLNMLREHDDISVMVIRLNKKKVYTRLQDEKAVLYNYITNTLLDRIITKNLLTKNSCLDFKLFFRQFCWYLPQE